MTTSNENDGVPAHSDPAACRRIFDRLAKSLGLAEGTDSSTVLARFVERKDQHAKIAADVMALTETTTMDAALEKVKALKAKAERNRVLSKSFDEMSFAEKRWLQLVEPVLFQAALEQHRAKSTGPAQADHGSSVRLATARVQSHLSAKADAAKAAREAYLANPNPQTRAAAFGSPDPKDAA